MSSPLSEVTSEEIYPDFTPLGPSVEPPEVEYIFAEVKCTTRHCMVRGEKFKGWFSGKVVCGGCSIPLILTPVLHREGEDPEKPTSYGVENNMEVITSE